MHVYCIIAETPKNPRDLLLDVFSTCLRLELRTCALTTEVKTWFALDAITLIPFDIIDLALSGNQVEVRLVKNGTGWVNLGINGCGWPVFFLCACVCLLFSLEFLTTQNHVHHV